MVTAPDRPTESDLTGERARERGAVDLAWERALELAWESFCGGTTPVGAVVTDAAGAMIMASFGRIGADAVSSAGDTARIVGRDPAIAGVTAHDHRGARLSHDRGQFRFIYARKLPVIMK
jgi:hypothetical protein